MRIATRKAIRHHGPMTTPDRPTAHPADTATGGPPAILAAEDLSQLLTEAGLPPHHCQWNLMRDIAIRSDSGASIDGDFNLVFDTLEIPDDVALLRIRPTAISYERSSGREEHLLVHTTW